MKLQPCGLQIMNVRMEKLRVQAQKMNKLDIGHGGVVVHACNSGTQEAEARDYWESEASL